MTIDSGEVRSSLPPDGRVGSVRVVDADAESTIDSQGEDALKVVLTLEPPSGETWDLRDMDRLEALVRRGLVRAGELRQIIFWIRPESDPDAAEEAPPGRA